MATKTEPQIVRAKDTFSTGHRLITRGQLLPATDPLVKAKPGFFAPYDQPKA